MTPEIPTELEPFHFTSSIEDGWLTVIQVQGEFHYPGLSEFEDACRAALEANRPWLLIDFMEVDIIFEPGFDTLVGVVKQARDRGGCLSVACDNPILLNLLARSDTKEFFNTRSSIEEARSLLQAKQNASEA